METDLCWHLTISFCQILATLGLVKLGFMRGYP